MKALTDPTGESRKMKNARNTGKKAVARQGTMKTKTDVGERSLLQQKARPHRKQDLATRVDQMRLQKTLSVVIVQVNAVKNAFEMSCPRRDARVVTIMVVEKLLVSHQKISQEKAAYDLIAMKMIVGDPQKMMFQKGAIAALIGQVLQRGHLMQEGKKSSETCEAPLRKGIRCSVNDL